MKRIKILPVLMLICLPLTGCSESKPENAVTLTITSSYSGNGIDGKSLGSGSFTEELFVQEGDIIYENPEGQWVLDSDKDQYVAYDPDQDIWTESPDTERYAVIAEIKEITEEKVKVVFDELEWELPYGFPKDVDSKYVVYDGINYDYRVVFTK